MITLKRLNVVRKVATEEQAAKLERLGFARTGGTAEAPVGAGVTEADLAKMGEAMFERLSENLKEAVAKATAQPPKRAGAVRAMTRRTRMEELISRVAATAQSDLKLPDEQLPTIKRYVKRAINRIKVFCNREDFPEPLEDVAAQIVEDMLKADQVAPTENDVSSITRGDTSISYRDKTSALKETVSFVKNYESQLIPFKRMKLPKDRPHD